MMVREEGIRYLAKLRTYVVTDDLMRADNLAQDLACHNIRTKDDLQATMSYFQTRLPAILTPIIIAKLMKIGITRSRYKAETLLVEDFAYIYVNFDKFEEKLKQ